MVLTLDMWLIVLIWEIGVYGSGMKGERSISTFISPPLSPSPHILLSNFALISFPLDTHFQET
jgi:hypothetical protein